MRPGKPAKEALPKLPRSRRGWSLCHGAKWPDLSLPMPAVKIVFRVRGKDISWNLSQDSFWYPRVTWETVATAMLPPADGVEISVVWSLDFDPYNAPSSVPDQLVAAKVNYKVGNFEAARDWFLGWTVFRAETPAECLAKLASYYTGRTLAEEIERVKAELVAFHLKPNGSHML